MGIKLQYGTADQTIKSGKKKTPCFYVWIDYHKPYSHVNALEEKGKTRAHGCLANDFAP